MPDPKIIGQAALEVGTLHVRITIGIKETLLRRQATPAPVHVNRAPFQNYAGLEAWNIQKRCNILWQIIVCQEIGVLATPGVELPIADGDRLGRPRGRQKNRSAVAYAGIGGGVLAAR